MIYQNIIFWGFPQSGESLTTLSFEEIFRLFCRAIASLVELYPYENFHKTGKKFPIRTFKFRDGFNHCEINWAKARHGTLIFLHFFRDPPEHGPSTTIEKNYLSLKLELSVLRHSHIFEGPCWNFSQIWQKSVETVNWISTALLRPNWLETNDEFYHVPKGIKLSSSALLDSKFWNSPI